MFVQNKSGVCKNFVNKAVLVYTTNSDDNNNNNNNQILFSLKYKNFPIELSITTENVYVRFS